MEYEDDFDWNPQLRNDNFFWITNRSSFEPSHETISNTNDKEEETNQNIKAWRFIQFMNQEEIQQKKNTRDWLRTELEGARERWVNLVSMINLATIEKAQIKFRSLTDNVSTSYYSKEMRQLKKWNILKKSENFRKSIEYFKLDLSKQREKTAQSQELFTELLELKNIGFYVDDSFQINDNYYNSKDQIIVYLQNKYITNWSSWIPTNKHYFKFIFNNSQNKPNELKNEFYTNFISNYRILLSLELILENENWIKLNYIQWEEIIKTVVEKSILNMKFTKSHKYYEPVSKFLKFYFRYLLYKFITIEINTIIKYNNNQTTFVFKEFTVRLSKQGNEISVNFSYLNIFSLKFSIMKISWDMLQIIQKKYLTSIPNQMKFINTHVYKLLLIFINNLIYDMKLNRKLKEFTYLITNTYNKTQSYESIIDYGILIKNMSKVCSIIWRRACWDWITAKIFNKNAYHYVRENTLLWDRNYQICKFIIFKTNNIVPNNTQWTNNKTEIILEFHRYGQIALEIKTNYPNQIHSFEKEKLEYQEFKKVDINYIYYIINNWLD